MLLITNVYNIQIPEPLGRGLQLSDGVFLTNERERIAKLVSPTLERMMGGLEYRSLLDTAHAIHWTTRAFPKAESDPQLAEKLLADWLQMMRVYLQSLWLVRDHAVDCEIGFAESEHPIKGTMGSSNFIGVLTFKSDGSRNSTEFTLDELKTARSYCNDFLLPLAVGDAEYLKDAMPKPRKRSPFSKGRGRLNRFNYFLSAARSEGQPAVRVSLYMTCMEILFSTETAELTHLLSQRVAFFLGDTSDERKEIFRTMKRAYGIRSKIVHGGTLSPKWEDELEQVSIEIDALVRRIFVKILGDKELFHRFEQRKEDELNDYFLDLIFQKGV